MIAQGHEGGGHASRIGTLALVPQVVDAVSPTPVVPALALGAVGIWVGTVAADKGYGDRNLL